MPRERKRFTVCEKSRLSVDNPLYLRNGARQGHS